jgi:hypothetical protein
MSQSSGFIVLPVWSDLAELLSRLALDLFFASLVIKAIYQRIHGDREFVFTYYLFNLVTFFLCLLLRKVPAELGFALAIFGVFGILRYRTEQIRNRDLTYLFIVIGIGILNSVANKETSLAEMLIVNSTLVGFAGWLERRPRGGIVTATPLLYDRLDLLTPGNEDRLAADILARTGHALVKVQVHKVDLLRDAAEITLFHRPATGK